jgi:hypothetical protein
VRRGGPQSRFGFDRTSSGPQMEAAYKELEQKMIEASKYGELAEPGRLGLICQIFSVQEPFSFQEPLGRRSA